MFNLKRAVVVFLISSSVAACGLVSSQEKNAGSQNAANSGGENTKTEANKTVGVSKDAPPDDYEIAKAGAERLNAEPLPESSKRRAAKPLAREQIRELLIRDRLDGESKDGKIGGGKVSHFSHTCDLFVDNRAFRVVHAPIIIRLASFARQSNRVLIYDDALRLVHNLTIADAPLFCDGNRLFFSDYKTSFFYGEPEKEVKGNVLIFTNAAKEIEGRTASLNFYRFGDLIH